MRGPRLQVITAASTMQGPMPMTGRQPSIVSEGPRGMKTSPIIMPYEKLWELKHRPMHVAMIESHAPTTFAKPHWGAECHSRPFLTFQFRSQVPNLGPGSPLAYVIKVSKEIPLQSTCASSIFNHFPEMWHRWERFTRFRSWSIDNVGAIRSILFGVFFLRANRRFAKLRSWSPSSMCTISFWLR